MESIVAFILATYAVFCFAMLYTWQTWQAKPIYADVKKIGSIAVIIPVRNEAQNISQLLEDLEKQLLAKEYYEVLVVNDQSTDNTAELVKNFMESCKMKLRLINLSEDLIHTSPKKRAITKAIEETDATYIITTDGDCRVPNTWLESIFSHFLLYNPLFISAPVGFHSLNSSNFWQNLWNRAQQIEFSSLIISGAIAIRWGKPNMCSGANIAYKKEAFLNVNGYEGNEQLASGDDEFLMHKIAKNNARDIHYLKSKKAMVFTDSIPTLAAFYQQRKRWASKWTAYTTPWPKIVAVFIFMVNVASIIALFNGYWLPFFSRIWVEFLLLGTVQLFFGRISNILYVPLIQLAYPFYVVFFGLMSSNKKTYIWKDRNLK